MSPSEVAADLYDQLSNIDVHPSKHDRKKIPIEENSRERAGHGRERNVEN